MCIGTFETSIKESSHQVKINYYNWFMISFGWGMSYVLYFTKLDMQLLSIVIVNKWDP